ncbi:hypothetical protein L7F22_024048 [Adiantum nelumboides]|nr:hypothetical protein [Adiantum nelumboides]
MTKNSGLCIKLANQTRVRCLGIIKDLEVEVFDVKVLVNCHVMPAGIGAFPLILGRPWLQATKAVQDRDHGTITLYNRSGDKKKFDMATKQYLDADFDEDDDDEKYSSSEEDDGEESSELDDSSDDSDVEVSSLFLEEEKSQKQATLCLMENEDTSGPYEQIEGLMQPKVQPNVKDELIQKMLSPDLTSYEKGVYLHMLQLFPNLFITSYEEVRGFKVEEINIPIKEGSQPVRQKLRRMGQFQLNALKEEVDKLLKAGFIYPVSTADWVSPVVITPKKDGKWRVCVDYKPLNATMKRDQKKTTFITPWGYFCYRVVPFGLMNGCACTRKDHCSKLEVAFKQYDESGGQLNPKKFYLAQPRVKFLGHMVSKNSIEADPDKVKALILLPSPKDTKQLATFLQKVKYMSRFIPLSSQLLYPLQQVAKLDPLQWSNECEEVFQRGGVVIYDPQGNLVTKRGSKLTAQSNNEAEYDTLEKGLQLCLELAIQRVKVKGDALLVVKQVLGVWQSKNPRLKNTCFHVKNLLKHFEAWSLRHIDRSHNEEAHAAAQAMIGQLYVIRVDSPLYLGREYLEKEEGFLQIGLLPAELEKSKKYAFLHRAKRYMLVGDSLYMKGADIVMRRVPWKEEIYKILEENHEGSCGGHFASKITLHKILQEGYVWPSIQRDVHHWCKSCKECQSITSRVLRSKIGGTILAYDVFEKWGIDAIGPLPITARGKCYILTTVDYLSRWAEAKRVK